MKKNFIIILIAFILLIGSMVCLALSNEKKVEWVKYIKTFDEDLKNPNVKISSMFVSKNQKNIIHITSQNEDVIDDYVFFVTDQGIVDKSKITGKIGTIIKKAVLTLEGNILLIKDSLRDIPVDFNIENVSEKNEVQWFKQIKGNGNLLNIRDAINTNDNGFIICGEILSTNKGMEHYLLKIDKLGKVIWQKIIGSNGDDVSLKIESTNDSGFIVVGKSNGTSNKSGLNVMKFNKDGNMLWNATIGGTKEEVNDLCVFKKCIFITTFLKKEGTTIYKLTKIMTNGKIAWVQKSDSKTQSYPYKVKNDEEKIILLSGMRLTVKIGQKTAVSEDILVSQINEDGKEIWKKQIGGSKDDFAQDLLVTKDGYIVSGITYSNDGDMQSNPKGCKLFLTKIRK